MRFRGCFVHNFEFYRDKEQILKVVLRFEGDLPRSLAFAELVGRLDCTRHFFAGRKANGIDRDAASAFVKSRRAENISNDAINNSLRLLRRMFNLARDTGKLTNVPKFELLRGKSRSEFLPPESLQKLVNAIPVRFVPLLVLLYQTAPCSSGRRRTTSRASCRCLTSL